VKDKKSREVKITCKYKDTTCSCQIRFKNRDIFDRYKKLCPKVRFKNVKVKQIIEDVK